MILAAESACVFEEACDVLQSQTNEFVAEYSSSLPAGEAKRSVSMPDADEVERKLLV